MNIKKKWADLIMGEIKNPLTKEIELSRDITFDKAGLPIMNLVIMIKQSASIDEFGTEEIHRLHGTTPPLLNKEEYN